MQNEATIPQHSRSAAFPDIDYHLKQHTRGIPSSAMKTVILRFRDLVTPPHDTIRLYTEMPLITAAEADLPRARRSS